MDARGLTVLSNRGNRVRLPGANEQDFLVGVRAIDIVTAAEAPPGTAGSVIFSAGSW